MADHIVFRYPDMETTADKIDGYAKEYLEAANTFKAAMQAATESWEGVSKQKFTGLVEQSVYNYMSKSVPEMVNGLATLLRKNAETMSSADDEIAKKIPDSIY